MRANPYASPRSAIEAGDAADPGSLAGRALGSAFLLFYPLPFFAALGVWLAHSLGAIAIEAPVVPIAVQGGSLIAATCATRTLARTMLCGPLFGPALTAFYLLAVAAAWPLARLCCLFACGEAP